MTDDGANTPTRDLATIEWLFNNSHELMFVASPDGCFRVVNPAWSRSTGWQAADVVGQPMADFAHPDELEMLRETIAASTPERPMECVSRLRLPDGSWRGYQSRIQLAPDGSVIGAMRDATAERERQLEAEAHRRTSELLSNAAGIGAWSYEPEEGRTVWQSDPLPLTGYTNDEISTPEQFSARLAPDERDVVHALFSRGVELGEPQTFEHRFLGPDGGWTTWRVTFHTEPRPGGLYALRGVSQNITELAAARDAAMQRERDMRQLVQAAPFAVAMFDHELRYMVVSPRWKQAFGLDGREYMGRRLQDVFPGVPKRFIRTHARVLQGEVVTSPEDRFTDSQGARHWIRWEGRPWRDSSGKIGGMLAYIDDISALAQARQDAQVNARRLKMALSAADAGVYEIDHVNRTFWASPEFKKVIGRSEASYEDALRLAFPPFHPDDMEQVRQAFLDIHAGRRRSGDAFEARILRPDGEARWVRVHHHLTKGRNGRWLKGVGLVLDYDDRKRQELALLKAQRAAEAGAEAKAAFLANMSHEIRTPMNGVMGVLHLLKSEQLSDEGRRMLDDALSCGHMLAELLNDVIDFSKIEAGRLELSAEPIEPATLLDGVARLLGPQAKERGLSLTVNASAAQGHVISDPVRLRQALFNLIGNAVKFTLEGEVKVRATVRDNETGAVLRFEVEDTGVGIPAEVQPRIFQRFDQGDASTTRRFGGSGLGLAITKRLAEMMGGQVGFTSVERQGSTFWFEAAVERCEAPAAADEALGAFLQDLRVLVVEDNATNRMIATKLLESLGASVETAADGYLGVEAAGRSAFDLILMDVQMPGIDGLEAARRIRGLPGAAARTPIVALTANVMSHQRTAYLQAGMDGVVGKPISPAALLAEIARLGEGPAIAHAV